MDSSKSLPSYLSKRKRNILLVPLYLFFAVALTISGCDQTPSGADSISGTGTINAAVPDSGGAGEAVTVTYDSDDGAPGEWTLNDPEFATKGEQSYSGDYSIGATTNKSSNETVAYIEPPELSGGEKIKTFSFYYRETTDNTGAGIRLLDSEGTMIVAAASGNPNYNTYGAEGYQSHGKPTSSDYQVWVKAEIVFDWPAGTADITFTDTQSDESETHSVDLAGKGGVSRIEIADYHNPADGGFTWGIRELLITGPMTSALPQPAGIRATAPLSQRPRPNPI